MTAHRVITNGGEQPNVIPSQHSRLVVFPRSHGGGRAPAVRAGHKIAQGAAMMTNCEVTIDVRAAVWPVRFNQTMAEVIQRNIEAIGVPHGAKASKPSASALQRQAKAPRTGFYTKPSRRSPGRRGRSRLPTIAATSRGKCRWAACVFPSNVPHLAFHHWTAGAALATSIAHKGGEAGAKALATSVIDYLMNQELVAATRASFAREIGDAVYKPLIPNDQRAPADLNAALMDKFRPQMEAHYIKEPPVFRV